MFCVPLLVNEAKFRGFRKFTECFEECFMMSRGGCSMRHCSVLNEHILRELRQPSEEEGRWGRQGGGMMGRQGGGRGGGAGM